VHSGRPHPCSRLLLAVGLAALVALAGLVPVAAAAATRFHRDETPLPADVSGLTADTHASVASAGASAGGGGTVLHMLLALAIVIGLIFGLYKLLRRTANRNDTTVRADGKMTVVASTPLAHSRSLHLVRVGEELVLVGSGEQAVTPIRVYSAEEARTIVLDDPDDGMRPLGSGGGKSPGFLGFLNGFTDSLRKATAR
jgi:flagellar biogenesis protein FliO